ncbi:DUF6493 family protein [Streptomyces sp. TN58]|uniref:DUF7824 domain-containing protein n=1 Tax=Streptomyces sp. TN58 TaxID=234612 RepID=UPI0009508CCE|nr:DUF6493 family protein [Streptomyces sp. TN58]APU38607.1 hypothetical protein BSL84_01290 [Streptomyces sp. TN58]
MIWTATQDTLPPVPPVRRLDPAPEALAETVELTAAHLGARAHTVADFERSLDGLVRHAHHDRHPLTRALSDTLGHRYTEEIEAQRLGGVDVVAATLLWQVPGYSLKPEHVRRGRGHEDCAQGGLELVLTARLREIAYRLRSKEPLPFLLSTPTWDTGTLEAAELVERLTEYRRLGVRPGPADFGQALLRVRRDNAAGAGGAAAATAAARLGTAEGARLAAWLGPDGEPAPVLRRVVEPDPSAHTAWQRTGAATAQITCPSGERAALQREFPEPFHWLGRPHEGFTQCYHWHGGHPVRASVLPEDRETQAAWLLPQVTLAATAGDHGSSWMLPHLARLGGPAGPALHAAVAAGLGGRSVESRSPAVEALLVLAARGDLDAPLLGRELAAMTALGTVKPNRLADAARSAAAAGAHATLWTVLAEVLPALLPSVRGAGEVLAVAASCAEHCAATGPVPDAVAAAAARRGSSTVISGARRLSSALTGRRAGLQGVPSKSRPGGGVPRRHP